MNYDKWFLNYYRQSLFTPGFLKTEEIAVKHSKHVKVLTEGE